MAPRRFTKRGRARGRQVKVASNPRLQRTRLRSPLSRKLFGASSPRWLRVAAFTWALQAAVLPAVATAKGAEAKIDAFGVFREADVDGGRNTVLVRQTDTLEACAQTLFGYHVIIQGLRPGSQLTFRKVITHPAMHKPDKSISTGYERQQTATVRSDGTVGTFQGYGLDEKYECVPGLWTIEFWYERQKLAAKTFTLTKCGHP
jgi:Domain of unknown function (DUF3859)